MKHFEATKQPVTMVERGPLAPLFAWLGGRRGMIIAAATVIGAGLWLNWGWLTAIGAAPILLALAPCAVMCGLGLCIMRGGSDKSCSSGGSDGAEKNIDRDPHT